jgi:guanyl-specific ribonuclease Sa
MKSRKTIALSTMATLAIAAAPMTSHADNALNACINAFIDQHVPKDRELIVRKIDATGPFSTSRSKIQLSARGARSGEQIALATCIVDGSTVSILEAGAREKIAAATR